MQVQQQILPLLIEYVDEVIIHVHYELHIDEMDEVVDEANLGIVHDHSDEAQLIVVLLMLHVQWTVVILHIKVDVVRHVEDDYIIIIIL